MDLIRGTPCEAAIEKAMQLARQTQAGEIDPFVGGRQIAALGSVDCYDFLEEVDLLHRQFLGMPFEDTPAVRAEIAEEIRRAARTLLEQFGPKTDS